MPPLDVGIVHGLLIGVDQLIESLVDVVLGENGSLDAEGDGVIDGDVEGLVVVVVVDGVAHSHVTSSEEVVAADLILSAVVLGGVAVGIGVGNVAGRGSSHGGTFGHVVDGEVLLISSGEEVKEHDVIVAIHTVLEGDGAGRGHDVTGDGGIVEVLSHASGLDVSDGSNEEVAVVDSALIELSREGWRGGAGGTYGLPTLYWLPLGR